MATSEVHSARPVGHLPSSVTLGLLVICAALQVLLLDGVSAAQEPELPDEHARVAIRPEILSLRTGERRLYVPLRRKRAAIESFAGPAVSSANCTFEGAVYEQGVSGTGRAVVIACPGDKEVHAMIITAQGEAISVAPNRNHRGGVADGNEDEGRHVVGRVPSTSKLLTSWSKLSTRRRRATASNRRAIELAVFVDAALRNRSPNENELHKRLIAMLEQIQLILEYRSLGIPIGLDIVHLEVLDSKSGPSTAGGEIDNYLDNFCTWQCRRNKEAASQGRGKWDHAILMSGLDLHSGKSNNVIGLAFVGGMCQCRFSCSIIQAENFQAALEAAHEMGHNLGMDHDGTGNKCNPSRFIMSPSVGAGRTSWSACSRQYLDDFLKSRASSCLASKTSHPVEKLSEDPLPGQLFPADDQCQLALGAKYRAYTSSRSPFNDVCQELWCQEGPWASSAHPALDGTSCATGKYCREGSCVVAGQDGGSAATSKTATRTTTTTKTTPRPRRRNPGLFSDIANIWDRWFRRGISRTGCKWFPFDKATGQLRQRQLQRDPGQCAEAVLERRERTKRR
ncbi:A disintegrin and metalloproteinase with thrombospondin motifs 18-like isoform X1 [Dermacentor albipictus]|uniref:A disintegrin and metalloproteinase with thrombospondin motifs 18-like isoform X1 n=1 Tax=Dermacentor albipictus TaxID=60249 RepID=UPI0038FCC39A